MTPLWSQNRSSETESKTGLEDHRPAGLPPSQDALGVTPERKTVYDQFVKSRIKEEYKEKKTKLLQARERFKVLLEESKITSRSTFREFCLRYRGDHRFHAFNRKKEQEVLFNHYITSLKRRDKENRERLSRMR
ncbi:unnamed protein product [Merluccius merluccius]